MFTARSDPAVAAAVVERAFGLPRAIGDENDDRYAALRCRAPHRFAGLCARAGHGAANHIQQRKARADHDAQGTDARPISRCCAPLCRRFVSRSSRTPAISRNSTKAAQTNALIDSFLASLPSREQHQSAASGRHRGFLLRPSSITGRPIVKPPRIVITGPDPVSAPPQSARVTGLSPVTARSPTGSTR